jgi:flagellar protein FlaF
MHSAAQAYGSVAKKTAGPRELEADLLLKAASRLLAIQEEWDAKQSDLEAALLYNRKLWTIFLTSVTGENNPLPAEIRQNVANLGIFVMNRIVAMNTNPKPEQLTALIKINCDIAAGLRGSA